MNLQQLRYICEVENCGLNVSLAAEKLHTAQPGVSNQIRLLEDELKIQIFERNGKRLVGVTEPGRIIINMAKEILQKIGNIRQVGTEFSEESCGTLSIATTHTQARYSLPPIIKKFTERYPDVRLQIHQGSSAQISELAATRMADIAIATEAIGLSNELVVLPCYKWNRCVVVPPGHPLLHKDKISLANLAEYPIVTYDSAFTGRSKVYKAFDAHSLKPNVVLAALDADVIKTYVELGLGIGLMAEMAFDTERDTNLHAIDVSHLFEPSTTSIGLRRGSYLRGFTYAFIEMMAPHLTREVVDESMGLTVVN